MSSFHFYFCIYLRVSSKDLIWRGFQDLAQEKLLRDHQSLGFLLRNFSPSNSGSRAWVQGQWHPVAWPYPQGSKHIQPPDSLRLYITFLYWWRREKTINCIPRTFLPIFFFQTQHLPRRCQECDYNRVWQHIRLLVYQPQLFCFGWYKMFLSIDATINNRCSKWSLAVSFRKVQGLGLFWLSKLEHITLF